jgi:hypothetical protein
MGYNATSSHMLLPFQVMESWIKLFSWHVVTRIHVMKKNKKLGFVNKMFWCHSLPSYVHVCILYLHMIHQCMSTLYTLMYTDIKVWT